MQRSPSVSVITDKQSRSSNQIKMNTTLPTFHGRHDSNIGKWLYSANRTLEMAEYTDYEKVAIASNYLRDLAAQDYMLHEKMVGKENWFQFVDYMRKKYTPANQGQIIREKLN